jgi:hypothetical protein
VITAAGETLAPVQTRTMQVAMRDFIAEYPEKARKVDLGQEWFC